MNKNVDLSEFIATPEGVRVPNKFPSIEADYRVAIIGEAPGKNEVEERKPFVGASGFYLDTFLKEVGFEREAVYIGNVCQLRPPNNRIDKFDWAGPEIQTGIEQLRQDIPQVNPNITILLGKTALRAAKGVWHDNKGKERQYSLEDWRGSLFICDIPDSPFYGRKCMATYHPANLFREYSNTPLVRVDFKRANRNARFPELKETTLRLDVEPHLPTIIARFRAIKKHRIPISIDIEGGFLQGISCLSISPTAQEAFIVPFMDNDRKSFWTVDEETLLLYEMDLVFSDPEVPKILQNSQYDRFVLFLCFKILVRNVRDDTMLKHWELYCEMAKSLALQTSIYTDHAFYKDERLTSNLRTFWSYCCKDSAITNQISETLDKALPPASRTHYRFNTDLLDPFLYIELKGMLIDDVKRVQKVEKLKALAFVDPKKKIIQGTEQLELDRIVGYHLNVNSSKQMCKFLYEDLRLPVKLAERADGNSTPTADYETLLNYGNKYKDPRLLQCIKVRRIRKHISDLVGLAPNPDGRIQCSTNIVGTETGRTTQSKAPTGKGRSLQNILDDDRDIFVADPGHDFAQCDLAGADGWTVAAHCARLGDSVMLEDYLYGLKPAKIIALMHFHGAVVNSWTREQIKQASKGINAETDKTSNPPYIYYACKRIQHGRNYRMGPAKCVSQIYMDTEGEVDFPVSVAEKLQGNYDLRYRGVDLWHNEYVFKELRNKGYLVAASGNRRIFFGRKDDVHTMNEACSQEPQHNTTWVTNLALLKLWRDPENHRSDGSLIIWPCHQVHDALCMQWPSELREWAIQKVRYYFNNPIIIAGQQITIPFEGHIGPSWGEHHIEFGLL